MNIRRDTLYNLAGSLAPVVLLLATVPLFLDALGAARYGVLSIVMLLTGALGVFDLGLGQATAYKIARSEKAGSDESGRVLWTAVALNIGFGLFGAAMLYLVGPLLFQQVFNIPAELIDELMTTLPWIAAAIPLVTLEGVFAGTLMGKSMFLALNVRAVLGSMLVQIVPLAAVLLFGADLTIAIPATVTARFLSVLLFAFIAFRSINALGGPRFGERALFKELLSYGGWVTLGKTLLQVIANLDRFVIASVLTPVAVTLYTVPFQLVVKGAVIPRALGNALFPRFAQRSPEEANALAMRAIRTNLALMTPLCLTGIALLKPFLSVWIDPDFAADASLVGYLIALSVWFNSVAVVAINVLEARGRPKETFLVSAVQAPPFVILTLVGVHLAGIVGVALARNVRSFLDITLLCWRAQLLKDVARLLALPFPVFICAILANDVFADFRYLLLANSVIIAVALGLSWRLYPEAADILFGKFKVDWRSTK